MDKPEFKEGPIKEKAKGKVRPEMNGQRLNANLSALSQIGKNEAGGIDRALGSQAEREARGWLKTYWEEKLSLNVRVDGGANLWVRLEGSEDLLPIVTGSHHDTVPNGGKFDGALGVLAATEVLETLIEKGIQTRHPIELVSFTGEEPNPYQVSTLGSKAVTGKMGRDKLLALKNSLDGTGLQEELLVLGGDLSREDLVLNNNTLAAFVELHIEQGRRLLDKNLSLAAVSQITGIYRESIRFKGEANHAGTTRMTDRHDAYLAACRFSLAFESLLKEVSQGDGGNTAGTIGYVKVTPNSANIIPGETELTLELRSVAKESRERVLEGLHLTHAEIERDRGVALERKVILDQPPVALDRGILKTTREVLSEMGEGMPPLVSMAGHDAAHIQSIAPTGMLFVRSMDGKSHCPEEYTTEEDVKKAADALLQIILKLDKELD